MNNAAINEQDRNLPLLSEVANLTVDLDKYPVNILVCPAFTDELTIGDLKVTDIGIGSDIRVLINAITDSELALDEGQKVPNIVRFNDDHVYIIELLGKMVDFANFFPIVLTGIPQAEYSATFKYYTSRLPRVDLSIIEAEINPSAQLSRAVMGASLSKNELIASAAATVSKDTPIDPAYKSGKVSGVPGKIGGPSKFDLHNPMSASDKPKGASEFGPSAQDENDDAGLDNV